MMIYLIIATGPGQFYKDLTLKFDTYMYRKIRSIPGNLETFCFLFILFQHDGRF